MSLNSPVYLSHPVGNNYLDEALDNYLVHGLSPGNFLTAVLANDLERAALRADHWNKQHLADIVIAVVQNCPYNAFGSYDIVKDWCADAFGCRSEWVESMREQNIIRKLENSY